MEEHQITIANETLLLPSPFFVIATENPLEHDGTYPLPEAQLDRFLMKIIIDYPSREDEKQIFAQSETRVSEKSSTPPSTKEFLEIQSYIVENIRVDPKIYDYISDILEATRPKWRNTEEYIMERKTKESIEKDRIL